MRVVEIKNPENGKLFKVNGQRLNPFMENFDRQESSDELVDPHYRDVLSYPFLYSFSFPFLVFLYSLFI